MRTYPTYIKHPMVDENTFIGLPMENTSLPKFEQIREILPQPCWENRPDAIDCYWKVWDLAFKNLRCPTPQSGFVANFIDTAFNQNVFMWDSVFILMFGRYGSRVFPFQHTLDNFYCKQHPDGFICREINMEEGFDFFERHDPTSTGPNVMAWSEWEYFLNFGDVERLARVFPPLVAYHEWTRRWRTWPDGTYFSSGWGCGMDNLPRVPAGDDKAFSHGKMTWIDANLQALLSARLLIKMAEVLKREKDISEIYTEQKILMQFINEKLWDDKVGFYCDRMADGSSNGVKSVAGFWALLADIATPERKKKLVEQLKNPRTFNRPHRVPALAADHPAYNPDGDYWCGGIWTPTNYMILRGLSLIGENELAHEIAVNHHNNVVSIFRETGTVWENYAPEKITPGNPAMKDFVGWSGLPPVTVMLEYVFGLRPDVPRQTLVWDVRLTDEHGVKKYPFGKDGLLDLICHARKNYAEKPKLEIKTNIPLTLELHWAGGRETISIKP